MVFISFGMPKMFTFIATECHSNYYTTTNDTVFRYIRGFLEFTL